MAPHWPNAILLPSERLVVALPRKAACSSMKRMLWKAVGIKGVGHHERTIEGRWDEIDMADAPDEYEWIGVMRHPYGRLCSGLKQVKGGVSLDNLVEKVREMSEQHDADLDWHLRPQRMYLQGRDGRIPTRWLTVEHLEDDWRALCRHYAWKPVKVEHVNGKGRYKAPDFLSLPDDVIQIIHRRWADDWRLYTHALANREGLRGDV